MWRSFWVTQATVAVATTWLLLPMALMIEEVHNEDEVLEMDGECSGLQSAPGSDEGTLHDACT